jgi:tyrosyl-tRNA synthetase
VNLKSDVELGATEQKFNLLVHRAIQREYGLPGQAILTMPILIGLDGQRKMSKSLGNYVGITEAPGEMFGKLMSIPDDLMWPYYELLTDLTDEEIQAHKRRVESGDLSPRDAKEGLAIRIVDDFHGLGAGYSAEGTVILPPAPDMGKKAAEEFKRVYREKQAPTEMPEFKLTRATENTVFVYELQGNITTSTIHREISAAEVRKWAKILVALEQVASASEAERLIKQGGFEVDGKIVKDPSAGIDWNDVGVHTLRVGKKKFVRVTIE